MQKFLSSSMVLSCTLLAVTGMTGLTVAPPVTAQDVRMLTVTGHGSDRIQTTKSQVELGVEIQRPTAEAVQQEVARRSSAVVELLRDRNVEKLQTTGIRLNPLYDYGSGQERLVGYVGENTVSFEVSTEQVGILLDDAIAAGATQISGIRFSASEERIASARRNALQEAVVDAQSQANTVLSALNLSAEEIVGIQIEGARGTTPVVRAVDVLELGEVSTDFDTVVVGGEQTVTATVTLQIRY